MIVTRCKDCPFFRTSILTMLLSNGGGVCGYDPSTDSLDVNEPKLRPGTESDVQRRRMTVSNPEVVPAACPLRTKSVVVGLSTGN